MKKVMVILFAGALAAFGLTGNALALHDGGVARCEACHTMHNSLNGTAVKTTATMSQFTAGPSLLKGSDQSSACLNCHEGSAGSYKVSSTGMDTTYNTIPVQRTPGGDFSWVKKGSANGHNIVAVDFGYAAETRMAGNKGPGGDYPVDKLFCSSCHDPHGKYRVLADGSVSNTGLPIAKYGSYGTGTSAYAPTATTAVGVYRLLGGIGYEPKSVKDQGLAFANSVPAALAPGTYNASEASSQVRVAYGSGMAEWCANCHGQLHNDSYPSNLRHPSGNNAKLTAAVAGNYNAYVKSGDLTGTQATSFNSLVPFETGQTYADRSAMAALITAATGPDTSSNVMCLSCHRAHASGFDSMLRWDGKSNLLTEAGVYKLSGTRTDAAVQAAYYDRPATTFASYQRSLCNKCHAKD